MTAWRIIMENGWSLEVYKCCGKDFPVETRWFLADFLEENVLMLQYNAEKQDHRQHIILIYIKALKRKLNRRIGDFSYRYDKEKSAIQKQLTIMGKRLVEGQNQHIQAADPICLFKALFNSRFSASGKGEG